MMRELKLDKLRAARGCSQAQMAQKLSLTQAAVSKFEFRRDAYISTIRRYVESLGGKLELHAVFPDERIKIDGINGDDMLAELKTLTHKHFQIRPLDPPTGNFTNRFLLRDISEDNRLAVFEKLDPGILVYIPIRRITELQAATPESGCDHALEIDGAIKWFEDVQRWRFVE